MKQPDNLVSVVLPTYNRAESTKKAIESVLSQTHEELELLVIDDASCDNTAETVLEYSDSRVQLYQHSTNKGGSAARNTGIRNADGDFIAFIDSDDTWKQSKLQMQLKSYYSFSQDVIGVYCAVVNRPAPTSSDFRKLLRAIDSLFNTETHNQDQSTNRTDTDAYLSIEQILSLEANIGGSSTLFFESDSVKKIGGFDPRFERHQDWEFLIRILQTGKIRYIDEPLVEKVGGGNADAETVERAKQLYFKKFSELIAEIERNGTPVRGRHYNHLARTYLRDGQWASAVLHLYNGSNALTKADFIKFMRSLVCGMILD
jgi:glycosyltransferase involved in cell wall biosynthesis